MYSKLQQARKSKYWCFSVGVSWVRNVRLFLYTQLITTSKWTIKVLSGQLYFMAVNVTDLDSTCSAAHTWSSIFLIPLGTYAADNVLPQRTILSLLCFYPGHHQLFHRLLECSFPYVLSVPYLHDSEESTFSTACWYFTNLFGVQQIQFHFWHMIFCSIWYSLAAKFLVAQLFLVADVANTGQWSVISSMYSSVYSCCSCVWLLKESDGDFNGDGSQQASASDEDFEGSSDSDSQRKKKRMRPEIPGERKSMRSCKVAGSMVCHTIFQLCMLIMLFMVCLYSTLAFWSILRLSNLC